MSMEQTLSAERYEAERAADPDPRDDDDDLVTSEPYLTICTAGCGSATAEQVTPAMGWRKSGSRWFCPNCRVAPSVTNCKLLGADICDHDEMTAEETEAVFGSRGKR